MEITLTQPDDFHAHLRDGFLLERTVPDIAANFRRAVVMPNLNPPVTDILAAESYRQRIQAAIPADVKFTPLMTLYLTDNTTPQLVKDAKQNGIIGFKLYPANVTTHAQFGVTDIEKLSPVFAALENIDLPLLIHGEATDPDVDIFDREAVFIDKILAPLLKRFPNLRVTLEHITTKEAIAFVQSAPSSIAATITAHHLRINRNNLLVGGIRPHLYCLPIPKRLEDQQALIQAAISGNPKFFLGTDSAPHIRSTKESACGCAGIYTGFSALPLYAEIFETAGALDKLENFSSFFGARFYQLPPNETKITLVKSSWQMPETLSVGTETLAPFGAGETLAWRVKHIV
jgi:dihydroorotase